MRNHHINPSGIWELVRYVRVVVIFATAVLGLLVLGHFPWAVDAPRTAEVPAPSGDLQESRTYYESVYSPPPSELDAAQTVDSPYVAFNQLAAHEIGVERLLTEFVRSHGLEDARVLEIGAGSGTLQDVVEDYTGLDIAATASRYFHKPFVQGSATDLPFDDGSFDVIWTVWTLEHVPNPERALLEMRRVVRRGGIIYLMPAWNVPTWTPQGLNVRPYKDLAWNEKLQKASLTVRETDSFVKTHRIPIRRLRWLYWKLTGNRTALHYTRLHANYDTYWIADSDAVNSLDSYESLLWFVSRGDECMNCASLTAEISLPHYDALIIKVNKT